MNIPFAPWTLSPSISFCDYKYYIIESKIIPGGENMKEEKEMFLNQYKEFYNRVPEKFKHCVTKPEYLDLSRIY